MEGMARVFLILGSIFAFLSVALGAFGAHGLRDRLSPSSLAIYQTGVQYQALHALALLICGALWYARPELTKLKPAGILFTAGIFIFSGSLYGLSISGIRWLGAITPIGGVCFLAGWVVVTIAAVSLPANPRPS